MGELLSSLVLSLYIMWNHSDDYPTTCEAGPTQVSGARMGGLFTCRDHTLVGSDPSK
jgi:hypothetical protein